MCGGLLSSALSLFGADAPKQTAPAAPAPAATESDAVVKVTSDTPRKTGKVKLSGKKRESTGLPGLGL